MGGIAWRKAVKGKGIGAGEYCECYLEPISE